MVRTSWIMFDEKLGFGGGEVESQSYNGGMAITLTSH